jgi:hypothetical protein
MFNFLPEADAMTWWTTHTALAPKLSTIPAGLPGHYFVMNAKPEFQSLPVVCHFEGGANDAVILAYKVVDTRAYAYGIVVDKIINFKPPKDNQRTTEIDEAQIFSSFKLPHAGIVSVTKLRNTDTHKIRDMLDNMVQYIPLFKQAKIKNLKDLEAVETNTVHANISRACLAAETRLRRTAKERGTTSRDANESAAGGMEAAKVISDVKGKLVAASKWYEPDLEDRFFLCGNRRGGTPRRTRLGTCSTTCCSTSRCSSRRRSRT